MPNLSALSRGTQVLAAAGLLLLIDMFLPWQDFGDAVGGDIAESLGVDATWNAWHGFWGVLMGLMVIALLAWVIARIMDVRLPVEVPDGPITVALGGLILLFALIKNLADDYSTIWSYIGVLLAAAVAYGAWLRYQEAGGTMDSLKAAIPRQAPSRSAGTSSSTGPAGTTPMQSEPDVTPTAPVEPTAPQPPQAARPAQPAPPAEPERTTGTAPPSPPTTEPMTQTGPTPPGPPTPPREAPPREAPPREASDETDEERRPPQPPPSSRDQT